MRKGICFICFTPPDLLHESSIIIIIIIIIILPSVHIIPGELKKIEKWEKYVRSSIRAVNGQQTVMQKDCIEALH